MINLLRLTSHKKSLGEKREDEKTYLLSGKIKLDLGRIYNELISSFQCVSSFLEINILYRTVNET